MLKRKGSILGIVVLIVTLGVSAIFAGMKKPPKEKKSVKQELLIPTQCIKNETIALSVPVIGKLEAQSKVDVYAEVSGILEAGNKTFLEGVTFRKGETLLMINNDKFRAEVYSRRSGFMNQIAAILPDLKFDYPESYNSWEAYLKTFEIEQSLKDIPIPHNEKEKYFLTGKNIYSEYYSIKSKETELAKYQIIAPFTGEVIESNIKPGTLVRTGQKLGEFVDNGTYDLVVGVDLNNLESIQPGNLVSVYSKNIDKEWGGTVRRISNKIDEKTQMVDVYISVAGNGLKQGMYLNADISLNHTIQGIEIPRKLLVNSNSVYIITDGVAQLQTINVIQRKSNTVIVEGLEDGMHMALKNTALHDGIEAKATTN
ncbi:HlyD family efflux transporter periplasmic adaptor subunit [Puteibacter caeruleilacunae]|nr:HlyD family efflux transporter periplasmic adaptor subunit [Puteibacter caeruleilacunae]